MPAINDIPNMNSPNGNQLQTDRFSGRLAPGLANTTKKGWEYPPCDAAFVGFEAKFRLAIPKDGGAFPILALREGARERTGIVLASTKAPVKRLPTLAEVKGPIVDLDLEGRLNAARPLPARAADRRYAVTLTGNMAGYAWSIQDKGPPCGQTR